MRDSGFEDTGGIMVPDLRYNDDLREQLMWNNAEITDPDLLARERFVKPPVDEIGDSKKKVLGSFRTLGENYFFLVASPVLFDEPDRVFRLVLTVSIHYHDRLAGHFFFNMGQGNGNGSLMTQVTSQSKDLNLRDRLRTGGSQIGRRLDGRTIIYQENFDFQVLARQLLSKLLQQRIKGTPIIKDRHDDQERHAVCCLFHIPQSTPGELFEPDPVNCNTQLSRIARISFK